MNLELTDHECDLLLEVLETAHRARILELHRTDSLDYKSMLHEKVAVIERLIERLAGREAGAGA